MADELNGHVRLTRDAILGAQDLPTIEVSIPEWGGSVFIRTMTGAERDLFEIDWKQNVGPGGTPQSVRARVAVATVCDEEGNLLFSKADMDVLSKKSSVPLDRVFEAAMKHNKLTDKDVEELRKNS